MYYKQYTFLSIPLLKAEKRAEVEEKRWKQSDLVSIFLNITSSIQILFCFLEVQSCNCPEGFLWLSHTPCPIPTCYCIWY